MQETGASWCTVGFELKTVKVELYVDLKEKVREDKRRGFDDVGKRTKRHIKDGETKGGNPAALWLRLNSAWFRADDLTTSNTMLNHGAGESFDMWHHKSQSTLGSRLVQVEPDLDLCLRRGNLRATVSEDRDCRLEI
jgi:hypothetical protein